ncbi:TPA: hypothetical protein PDU86_002741 [Staphylococcus aureus]|uniref:hypothetical protein n=1 Tax=Staphylococcus TaxID=1279 RepID=UPI000464A15C|nr:hypothetical protein [Staphylococcus epidermidis]MBE5677309.1 hypothetical protein [Staphylococcus singaporensis]HCX0628390.1 hypothetical protein [Staphylococcus aureus]MCG1566993.1 hypothetical protein [Staphylococcus epidermidis]HDA0159120.1 hypothetical protein [Staphylococcus aureus]HDE0265790.1 hypothetical protein [Staphylococcus aureus]
MSEYKKQIVEVFESEVTGYQISKETGISQNVISSIRNNKRDIDNLTLKTTEKLHEFYKKYLEK